MGLSSLNIKLIADLSQFSTAMQNAERQMQKTAKSMEKTGKSMSTFISLPLAAFGALAVKNFGEAEGGLVKLQAAISANGKDLQTTTADYQNFAAEMQNLTTIEDDAVIGFLQLAESMKAPDSKEAVKNAIGLSKAYGIDMPAALKIVVKAQEGQYMALGKLVPAIKNAGTESEKAALAQQIYANSFKVAEAETQTTIGSIEQMKNALGNATETIGGVIAKAIMPLVKWVKSLSEKFGSLSETQAQWVVGIMAVVAAIGPMLFIGAKMITSFIAIKNAVLAVRTAMLALNTAFLANPITYVILAIAALIIGFIALVNYTGGVGNAFKLMGAVAMATIKTIWEYVKAYALFLWNFGKLAIKLLTAPFRIMGEVAVKVFKSLPSAMKAAFTGGFDDAGRILFAAISDPLKDELKSISEDFKLLGDPFVKATENTKKYWGEVAALNSQMQKAKKLQEEIDKKKSVTPVISERGVISESSVGSGKPKQIRSEIFIEKVDPISADNAMEEVNDEMQQNKFEPIVEPMYVGGAFSQLEEDMAATQERIIANSKAFTDLVKSSIENAIGSIAESMGKLMTDSTMTGTEKWKALFGTVLSLVADFGSQFGKMLIGVGMAQIALDLSLKSMNPYLALAAGAALVIASAAAKSYISQGVQGFANGGIVGGNSLTGDRVPAMVNSREMILNTQQQGRLFSMANGGGGGSAQQIQVVGTISGNDIRLSNLRSTNRYNRI